MNWRNQTAAVVPCLNEAAAIGEVVSVARRHVGAVCVIDDGSADHTARAAEQAGALVIRHESSLGKGRALRAGWDWARANRFDWAVTLDGDGQHQPDEIPAFFRAAERSGAALIVGNRMGEASKMPRARRFVNRWMSRRLSRLSGRELPDSQCGFRLINIAALKAVSLAATHFEIESEMLVVFLSAGLRVEFTPVSVIYKSERSKIRPVRDALRWFRWLRQARRTRVKSELRLGIPGAPSVADA